MKQLILCLLLLAGFTAQAQQLSPNFYNQFKDILNTDWKSLKGEGLNEDRDNTSYTGYYTSKKNLDGFELTVVYKESKSGNTTYFSEFAYSMSTSDPGNVQLFEKIKSELSKLEKEGFKLQNGKNSFDIKSDQQPDKASARVSLNESRINIRFFKSNILKTVYSNGDVYEGDPKVVGSTMKGKYTWANGDVYEGDFVGDKFNGKGKLTLIDGKVYDGNFKDGKFLGSTNATGSTLISADPMESKFVTAFNAATNSEGRGKALQGFIDEVYDGASLTDEQKNGFVKSRIDDVYAKDKEALFQCMMKIGRNNLEKIRKMLSVEQGRFVVKRANEVTSDFKVVNPASATTSTNTNTTSSTPAIVTTPAGEAGLVWFKTSGSSEKYGLMDSTTKTVLVKPQYGKVSNFSEGLARVRFYEGAWLVIDKTGKGITPGYDFIGDFSEGLASVFSVYQWGFIDKTGEEIIKPKYDKASRFSEGLAAVNQKGKWGYIDKTGKEIIKLKYDDAFEFKNNRARVKLNGRDFYIDKTGIEIK